MDSVSVVSHEAGRVEKREAAGFIENRSPRTTFLACVGFHEYFSPEMWRAALTELMATGALVFTLTTSIIACLDSHERDPKFIVPIIVFIIAFLFLMATVPLSGGHMSPVFTFIAALKGMITFARASIYILAQCIGSIIGFLIIKSVMDHDEAHKYSLGGCTIDSRQSITKPKLRNCIDTGVFMRWPEPGTVLRSGFAAWRTLVEGALGVLGRAIFRLHCVLWFLYDLTKGRLGVGGWTA
ncbi:hypothetical protein F0562_020487 [Nyssa sinensis]|uniref:Aquaporin n=1 Tax=Nyssa sinensis TaxID=561372 RepID=A0A5J5BWU4_9ASTE|nr:hypothetical protein F0562_020487 [Nyssa sinensis]